MSRAHFILKEINIAPLLKARKLFERFRSHLTTDQEQAGAIQAFEFCYELAWKTQKRVLEALGVEVASPRETFREAARNNLIRDPELWFDFQKKRNLTSHTYNEAVSLEILAIFDQFSQELDALINHMENLK